MTTPARRLSVLPAVADAPGAVRTRAAGSLALALLLALPSAAAAQQDAAGPALAPTAATADLRPDGTQAAQLPPAPAAGVVLRPRPRAFRPRQGEEATLLADRVELSQGDVLTASGGVVAWFDGARLVAERVVYDGRAGTLRIEGPIHLTRPELAGTPDETVLIADSAQLSEDLQDGLLRGARLVLARELQMAATEVRRSGGGRYTTLSRVVASSCRVCAGDPTPLWEIRARRITHDAVLRELTFDGAQFRAFGVPIAALPHLTAPDPTVDRRTGFLRPQFRTTSNLGFGMKLPYFVTLGDSADLTLTPYLAASRTATLGLRYRQAMQAGAFELNGAVSRDDIRPGDTRGYLFGAGQFALPGGYQLGLQLQSASDRGYLLDYDVSDADRLWSGATLDRVRRNELTSARGGYYETLRDGEAQDTLPALVGDAFWQRRFVPAGLGGQGALTLSAHGHRRESGADGIGRDMARLSARLDWQRSAVLPAGIVAAAQTRVQADNFRIAQDSEAPSTATRLTPTAAVELRWPLVAARGSAVQVLEPIVQIAWSPERRRTDKRLPNEDSVLFELDEGNLFSLDRAAGWDARESGWRANIGVNWTRIDPLGWSTGVTLGRVLREHPDAAFASTGRVFGRKRSDWLLGASYTGANGLALSNRALFDDDLHLDRNELRLGWVRPGLQLEAGYLWIEAGSDPARKDDVSEVIASAGWQMAPGWWANAQTRYDFTAERTQKADLDVQYRNECVTVGMSLSRRYTASDSVRPDTSFGLAVQLGGFGRQPDSGARGTVARRACVR